jgi:hypothetical protein
MNYRLPIDCPFSISLSDWQQCQQCQQMPKLLVPQMTSGLDDTLTIFCSFAPTAQAFAELLGLTYVEAFHAFPLETLADILQRHAAHPEVLNITFWQADMASC